jgi:hypothetical protein
MHLVCYIACVFACVASDGGNIPLPLAGVLVVVRGWRPSQLQSITLRPISMLLRGRFMAADHCCSCAQRKASRVLAGCLLCASCIEANSTSCARAIRNGHACRFRCLVWQHPALPHRQVCTEAALLLLVNVALLSFVGPQVPICRIPLTSRMRLQVLGSLRSKIRPVRLGPKSEWFAVLVLSYAGALKGPVVLGPPAGHRVHCATPRPAGGAAAKVGAGARGTGRREDGWMCLAGWYGTHSILRFGAVTECCFSAGGRWRVLQVGVCGACWLSQMCFSEPKCDVTCTKAVVVAYSSILAQRWHCAP